MQKNINYLLLLSITFLVILAARTGIKDQLIGSWKLTDITAVHPDDMTPKAKELLQKDVSGMQMELTSTNFDFSKDGQLTFCKKNCGWTVSGSSVKDASENGLIADATIISLNRHKLIFSRIDRHKVKEILTMVR